MVLMITKALGFPILYAADGLRRTPFSNPRAGMVEHVQIGGTQLIHEGIHDQFCRNAFQRRVKAFDAFQLSPRQARVIRLQ